MTDKTGPNFPASETYNVFEANVVVFTDLVKTFTGCYCAKRAGLTKPTVFFLWPVDYISPEPCFCMQKIK